MFEVGVKVICKIDDHKAVIQFGPFEAASGEESYLVKWLSGPREGASSIVWACDLECLGKFEVGDKFHFSYDSDGEAAEVVAGPFEGDGFVFWVYKDADGFHDTAHQGYMVPVEE